MSVQAWEQESWPSCSDCRSAQRLASRDCSPAEASHCLSMRALQWKAEFLQSRGNVHTVPVKSLVWACQGNPGRTRNSVLRRLIFKLVILYGPE